MRLDCSFMGAIAKHRISNVDDVNTYEQDVEKYMSNYRRHYTVCMTKHRHTHRPHRPRTGQERRGPSRRQCTDCRPISTA